MVGHVIVPRHGVRMPRIIYGTAWKKQRTAEFVEQAIRLGFRGIDTACQPKHYNEPQVGEGWNACIGELNRADLYLQSKFTPLSGQDPNNVPYDPNAALSEQVAQSFSASLRNLRTHYLDCLVLHSPLATEQQTLQVWRAMEAIFDQGDVKQLGLSNCYNLRQFEALHQAARIKPAVLQNRFYADTGYDRQIRNYCNSVGVIYQSFWTLTANPHLLTDASVTALATKYQRTAAQILFRYLTQIAIVPLTGTTSALHMREDLAIFEFELDESECSALSALVERAR